MASVLTGSVLSAALPHAAKSVPWYEEALDAIRAAVPVTAIIASAGVVLGAVIAQLLLTWLIDRLVRRASTRAKRERLAQVRSIARTADLSQAIMSQRTEQRAQAIGSLLKSVVKIVIWAVAILMIMSNLGIAIGPLLASAGVIGVVLGFGAQTLVRDYLSGIFLIIEDQVGVGDVVDMGTLVGTPVIGTVEEVALRYTRLRDQSGIVWYVRNGEITRVGNRSQGWTLAVVDIPIPYDADLDRVRTIVNAVGDDMNEDPDYDEMLLNAPTFAGLESMSTEGVATIRVTAKAVPQMQVQTARRIRERMKVALDRAGISIAGPVTVDDASGDDGFMD